jgi:N,N'-diacetyllegionaminate synthase
LTTSKEESQYDMLKKLELDLNMFSKIKSYCENIEIDFMSTPYNFTDVDLLSEIGVSQFKIASAQIVELPFLRYVAEQQKPMILSTGMANLFEINEAVETIKKINKSLISVLQCTTNYPSMVEEANLKSMLTFKSLFDVEIGYSDHVPENYAAFAAVALGATIIEKHFTLNKNDKGPDHSSSLEPNDFKYLVNGIREIEKSLGSPKKIPTISENVNKKAMRRSLVVTKKMEIGEILKKEHIAFKRPEDGLSINLYDNVIGKKMRVNKNADSSLKYTDLIW